jgi:hypothetical protein
MGKGDSNGSETSGLVRGGPAGDFGGFGASGGRPDRDSAMPDWPDLQLL